MKFEHFLIKNVIILDVIFTSLRLGLATTVNAFIRNLSYINL